ncbi:hypothetical protein J4421_02830 [Candidatus Woesearchaeota archaeon]|nr:hypothetical protein [Candidatus Woesearchaeota archaeon]
MVPIKITEEQLETLLGHLLTERGKVILLKAAVDLKITRDRNYLQRIVDHHEQRGRLIEALPYVELLGYKEAQEFRSKHAKRIAKEVRQKKELEEVVERALQKLSSDEFLPPLPFFHIEDQIKKALREGHLETAQKLWDRQAADGIILYDEGAMIALKKSNLIAAYNLYQEGMVLNPPAFFKNPEQAVNVFLQCGDRESAARVIKNQILICEEEGFFILAAGLENLRDNKERAEKYRTVYQLVEESKNLQP